MNSKHLLKFVLKFKFLKIILKNYVQNENVYWELKLFMFVKLISKRVKR